MTITAAFVDASEQSTKSVSLLGAFDLSLPGLRHVSVSKRVQRVLALLALQEHAVRRSVVAGTLWPDSTQYHANASLRVALTRLRDVCPDLIEASGVEVTLASDTRVDMNHSRCLAGRLLDPSPDRGPADVGPDAIAALSTDLLPDWCDDWVQLEAEHWRQIRLRALEALARRLVAEQRFCHAAAAATTAVAADPLRETSRSVLIQVYLAEGNQSEAIHEFRRYTQLLRSELGLTPTCRLQDLVRHLGVA